MSKLFTVYDAALLRNVALWWRELSENPEAHHCMTDHCHVEHEALERIAKRIEEWLDQDAAIDAAMREV